MLKSKFTGWRHRAHNWEFDLNCLELPLHGPGAVRSYPALPTLDPYQWALVPQQDRHHQ